MGLSCQIQKYISETCIQINTFPFLVIIQRRSKKLLRALMSTLTSFPEISPLHLLRSPSLQNLCSTFLRIRIYNQPRPKKGTLRFRNKSTHNSIAAFLVGGRNKSKYFIAANPNFCLSGSKHKAFNFAT